MNHECINIAIIEKLREDNQHLHTKIEVLESNVNAVKENINDMKSSIKEIRNKMDSITRSNMAILSGVILAIIGAVANFVMK